MSDQPKLEGIARSEEAEPQRHSLPVKKVRDWFRDLARIQKSGGSVADLLSAFVKPAEALPEKLLQRAALVRSVDEKLYQEMMLRGITGPSFDDFKKRAEVECSSPDSCSLRAGERKDRMQYWSEHPDECRAFAGQLETYYRRTKAPFDELLQSLFARPDDAADRFLKFYGVLDSTFALSGCEALLTVLIERQLALSDDLRKAVNDREQYLRSRVLFAQDYYRTVVHLKREAAASSFEELLKSDNQWILQLHGGGGVGKTMFLRWLIARRCIPEIEGKRIPVARIDIDAFDRRGLGEYPGLVFLPLMRQLTQQLPGNPFESYLPTLGACEAVLQRPTGREEPGMWRGLKKEIVARSQSISNLPGAFASAIGKQTVLVVIDTIEDMLLHQTNQLESILRLLTKVHDLCPQFRLIISGRFDICEACGGKKKGRLPKFAADHKGQILHASIGNFNEDETRRYLNDLRKITSDDMQKVIWRKTKGHPLELTLLADLVVADSKLTPEKVRSLRPRYARLIERIIDRIPESQGALRWLLRYAVVPRHLDWEYIRDVVNHHVRREAKGKSVHDNPNRYPDASSQRHYGKIERWKPLDSIELETAWQQLKSYAAQTSWVTEEDGVIRLQPELVEPMRDVLRPNEVYRQLQIQSRQYFEGLAKKHDASWGRWTAEAVFHRLQLEDRGAIPYWIKQRGRARRRGFEELEDVASVVFGSEFMDDDLRPRLKIPRAQLALATYDLAYATLVHLLRMPVHHEAYESTVENLAQRWTDLKRYSSGSGANAISRAKRNLILTGYMYFSHGSAKSALKYALLARRGLNEPSARLALELLIASRIYWLKLGLTKPHFQQARRIAIQTNSRDLPAALVDMLFARTYLHADDLFHAGQHFLQCFLRVEDSRGAVDRAIAFRRAAESYYEAGLWESAESLQKEVFPQTQGDPNSQFQWLHAEARLRLKLGDFVDGFHSCKRAAEVAPGAKQRAAQLELQGEFEAARGDIEQAKASFEAAAAPYSESGSDQGITNCRLKTGIAFLDVAGDAVQARECLGALGVLDSPAMRVEAARLEVRMLAQTDHARAKKVWRKKLAAITADGVSARTLARFRILGLALGLAEEDDVKPLWRLLSAIRPESAVFTVFEDFEHFHGAPWAERWAPQIARYAPRPGAGAERILRWLTFANALHFFGQSERAAKMLLDCIRLKACNAQLESRVRRALFRIDPEQYPLAPLPRGKTKWADDPADPYRFRFLEEAERAFALDHREHVVEWLELARTNEWPVPISRSRWGIRANLLRASLQNPKTKDGRRALLNASDIAREIECPLPDWANRLVGSIRSRAYSEQDIAPPCFELSVELVPKSERFHEEAFFTWTAPGGGPRELDLGSVSDDLATIENHPFLDRIDIAPLLNDWRATASPDSSPLAIRIATGARLLEHFPWEAKFPPELLVYRVPQGHLRLNNTIRCLQRSLGARTGKPLRVDGILGPETTVALRSIETAEGSDLLKELFTSHPTAKSALLIQADIEDSRFLKRGHGAEGIQAQRIYGSFGVEAREYVYAGFKELYAVFREKPVPLIHLVSNFWETREGEFVPDISRSGGEPLSPRLLASAVYTKRPGDVAPIVIVEGILPPSAYDLRVQGVARNRFCADLFAAGDFKAVIGTGFWDANWTAPSVGRFIDQISHATTFRDLWRQAPRPMAWPPVLFTSNPDLPIWET